MTAKVALIDVRNMRITPDTENLGLARIAAYLREQKIPTSLHVLDSAQDMDKQLHTIDQEAQIFGFPIFHANYESVVEVAGLIKSRINGSFVIVGGLFASEYADRILRDCAEIDAVVQGYGEYPVANLASVYPDTVRLSKIAGLVTRNNLDKERLSPPVHTPSIHDRWPARDFVVNATRRPSAIAHLIRKSGCSHGCSFCLMNTPGNKAVKRMALRPAGDLAHEISALHDRHGFRIFMFHDCPFDDYGKEGVAQIEELCDHMTEAPARFAFQCMMNGRHLDSHNRHIIEKMKKAGFSQILFLLGAGNDRDRELIRKQKDVAGAEQLIEVFQRSGIEVMLEFFMTNPLSTADSLKENYLFLSRMGSYRLGEFLRKAPLYEGTALHRIAADNNFLNENYSYKHPYEYTYADGSVREVSSFLDQLSKDPLLTGNDYQFQNLVYLINWLKVLFPEELSAYLEDIDAVKKELHESITYYFQDLFLECSTEKARTYLTDFTKGMSDRYKRATSLQFRVFREPGVKSYILRR